MFQPKLQEALGKPAAVENRASASGTAEAARGGGRPHLDAGLRHGGRQPGRQGVDVLGGGAERRRRFLNNVVERWGRVIRDNITAGG